MKKNRLTAFIFACIGMGWLVLTYGLSIYIFQQMVIAAENGGTSNWLAAVFLAFFAAASLLIVVFLPVFPAIFGLVILAALVALFLF